MHKPKGASHTKTAHRRAATLRPKLDLTRIAVFRDVPPEFLALITEDMAGCFPTGAEIVREGDAAGGLIALQHGRTRVIADGTYIVTREAGEIIGEQAILDRNGPGRRHGQGCNRSKASR